jgi:hypothetical protein
MAFLKKMKSKVVDMTSDVLSARPQWQARKAAKQADRDVSTIKYARQFPKSANSFNENGVTKAGMARAAVDEVKSRLARKKK